MDTVIGSSAHQAPSTPPHEFLIQVAGLDLQFVARSISDPIPTGRQIAEAFGSGDPGELIVLQLLLNGMLEELRPDETTDLTDPRAERFVVVRSDRSFRLEVDGRRQEWPAPVISAMVVKTLGQQTSDDIVVVLQQTDVPDRELEEDELVALTESGIERFIFKHVAGSVIVSVNERPVTLRRGIRTGLEIKQAAIEQDVPIQVDFVLSLELGPGHTKVVGDSDRVRVKDGQRFVAIADDDNS